MAAGALLLAACGSADSASDSPATPNAAPPESTGENEVDSEADAWTTVVTFNEALVAQDWSGAADLAAAGSPAAIYVDYREAVAQAQAEAGSSDTSTGSVAADEATGEVRVSLETADGDVTYTWRDFEVADGQIMSWSTEQAALNDIVAAPGVSGTVGGATVTWTHAYVTNDGQLYAVLLLEASDDLIAADESIGVQSSDGSTVMSSPPVGLSEVDPGSAAYLLYRADLGELPAGLVYEVQNTFDAPAAVELAR